MCRSGVDLPVPVSRDEDFPVKLHRDVRRSYKNT